MKVYVDVIIFENFIINTFILMLTMRLTAHKYKMINLFLAGFIGSMYTLVVIVPELAFFCLLPIQIFVAVIMLRIVTGKIILKDFLKTLCVFFISTFSLSGICFLCALQQNVYILGNRFEINIYSIKYIILSIMALFIICTRLYDYLKERTFIKNYIFDVELNIDNKKIKFKGFLDSGNSAREPVTNLPCIIVEESILQEINIRSFGIYHIPYTTVKESDDLIGIRINGIQIISEKKIFRKIDAIVCPCKEKFSEKNEFSALLPRGII